MKIEMASSPKEAYWRREDRIPETKPLPPTASVSEETQWRRGTPQTKPLPTGRASSPEETQWSKVTLQRKTRPVPQVSPAAKDDSLEEEELMETTEGDSEGMDQSVEAEELVPALVRSPSRPSWERDQDSRYGQVIQDMEESAPAVVRSPSRPSRYMT